MGMLLFDYMQKLVGMLIVVSANLVPIRSPTVCMVLSVTFIFSAIELVGKLSSIAIQAPIIAHLIYVVPDGLSYLKYIQSFLITGAWSCAWLFQARCLKICFPLYFDNNYVSKWHTLSLLKRIFDNDNQYLCVAGMNIGANDLKTSVLVTGITGSSKTAGILVPLLSKLLTMYNREDVCITSNDPFQKLGAFIPEVKGDIVDYCIYLAHESGRVVSKDIIILTPSSRLPIIRYKDEQNRFWYLSAYAGSGISDAAELLAINKYFVSLTKDDIQNYLCSETQFEELLKKLGPVSITLGIQKPKFIGWRWSGKFLQRVSHTYRWNDPTVVKDKTGAVIEITPPKFLKMDGLFYIDNQVHYNIVDPYLPPAEVAERLTLLATMSKGRSKNSENDYFYDQARKLITACITLHRLVVKTQCTAIEIVKLVTDNDYLETILQSLENQFHSGKEYDQRSRLSTESLLIYFRHEWTRMIDDGKTATVIVSIITSTFDIFLQDPNLTETFCQKSTFSFEDVIQSGKIICLVPGNKYEQLGRILGTACKIDFQSTMLARTYRSDLNSTRLALYFADECHKYVTGGSVSAGDSYFMNLSRSNNVVNICATQSYAWLVDALGRDTANVYISAFGVQFWLQQTDPETCRRAADICGTVTEDALVDDQNINFTGFWTTLNSGKELVLSHQHKLSHKERFRSDEFSQLNVGEAISYNKGHRGKLDKVVRGVVDYDSCTLKPTGVDAVRLRVREYYREIIENITYESGDYKHWDNYSFR